MKSLACVLLTIGGGSLLVVGLALTGMPGPVFIAIAPGLAILAMGFEWARLQVQFKEYRQSSERKTSRHF